jgi:hypothetical protein
MSLTTNEQLGKGGMDEDLQSGECGGRGRMSLTSR